MKESTFKEEKQSRTLDVTSKTNKQSTLSDILQKKAMLVIQRNWVCSICDAKGPGKPKAKCPECGQKTLTKIKEKPTFGVWWEGLSGERRQALLRAHGSHESFGGVMGKHKGGGPGGKGDQHDAGNAKAVAEIRALYEAGRLE